MLNVVTAFGFLHMRHLKPHTTTINTADESTVSRLSTYMQGDNGDGWEMNRTM